MSASQPFWCFQGAESQLLFGCLPQRLQHQKPSAAAQKTHAASDRGSRGSANLNAKHKLCQMFPLLFQLFYSFFDSHSSSNTSIKKKKHCLHSAEAKNDSYIHSKTSLRDCSCLFYNFWIYIWLEQKEYLMPLGFFVKDKQTSNKITVLKQENDKMCLKKQSFSFQLFKINFRLRVWSLS